MSSPKGDTGIDVSTIFNDKVTIVGDHPNLLPTVYTDPTGIEINNYSITESSGMGQTKSAIPKHTALDNAGDFHGGTMTTTVMNSLHFEVANGGITMETGGNFSLSSWGGLFNIISSTEVDITSDIIKLNSTNTTLINGPTLYVDTDETIFNKNVQFGNNIMVNGGAAINGELIANHITTQRQVNFTEDCDALLGYPMMGAKLMCVITSPNPYMNGQAVIMFQPSANPIISIPGHNHVFEGPACTLADGVTGIFSKMKAAEGTSPVAADPAMPMNTDLSSLTKSTQNKIAKKAGEFLSDAIGL